MCLFFSLLPATWFLIAAYFVFFASARAEGSVRQSGRALAAWVLIVAPFFPLCGLYVTASGRCPMGRIMERMEALRLPRSG